MIYNDGGKSSTGRKGTSGDCGVRAMAIALGLDYDCCYKVLAQANKKSRELRNCNIVLTAGDCLQAVPKALYVRTYVRMYIRTSVRTNIRT